MSTLNPGANQVQSKNAQTLDVYGNITQSQVFAYNSLSTPARTYTYTYLTDANYTARYIHNRVLQVTLTDNSTSPPTTTTLVTNTYDSYRAASAHWWRA